LDWTYDLPPELAGPVGQFIEARTRRQAAEQDYAAAHVSVRDAAELFGLSYQRVAQIRPQLVGEQMARLRRLAHRIVCVDPRSAAAGIAPLRRDAMTHPDKDPAAHERSGADVVEGVETAAAGSEHGGVLRPPAESKPGTAPVEQTHGDPAMTGDADQPLSEVEVPETRMPEAPVSGGAQSAPSARVSDRISATDDDPR
jgi:hypothetical protein